MRDTMPGTFLPPDVSADDARAALERVLASEAFASSARHRALFRYLVESRLDGRTARLRETTLALDVFGRSSSDWDPASDPIVRVEMTRLRSRLAQHYANGGCDDPIRISVPKGGYVPQIERRATNDTPVESPVAEMSAPADSSASVERALVEPGVAPAHVTTGRRWRPSLAPTAVVALLALALSAWALWRTEALRAPPTVAVIPYAGPAGDRSLAETGEIVFAFMNVALARMPEVRVLASSSVEDAMRRTNDAFEAGRALAADYVLVGTVGRAGDGVSIETRLIRTRDRTAVLERRITGPRERAVREHASVANAVIAELAGTAPRVGVAEAFAMPADPVARERWITGRLIMSRFTPHAALEAERLFREVNEREPTFAPAYSFRATALWWGAQARDLAARDVAPNIRALAEQGIALDPTQPNAYVTMAAMATLVDYDLVRAEALYRQAIRLAPSLPGVHQGFAGGLLYMGRFDEALAEIRLARSIDPFNVSMRYYEAMILGYGRRYDEAMAQCTEALAVDATNPVVVVNCAQIATRGGLHERSAGFVATLKPEHASLAVAQVIIAHCLASAGDPAGAAALYARARSAGPVPDAWAYEEATLLLALGERGSALARLDDAFLAGQPTIVAVDPAWDAMRADPEFRALLERRAPQLAAVSEQSRKRRASMRLAMARGRALRS